MPKPLPSIHFLGSNYTDHTMSFAIGSKRYEYFLPSHGFYALEWQAQRYPAKALARAKRKALRWEKLA